MKTKPISKQRRTDGPTANGGPNDFENTFRKEFIDHNQVRARISCLIGLVLILWVSLLGFLSEATPALDLLTRVRLGVIFPATAIVFAASYVPWMKTHYTPIVATGIIIAGLGIIYLGVFASKNGISYLTLSSVLVLVHATLLLGLRTRVSALTASTYVLGYGVLAIAHEVPNDEFAFTISILSATAVMCVLSVNSIEQALRKIFLEKQQLAEQAQKDGLTDLFNRRQFDILIRQLWEQAHREHQNVQIMLVDIDRFKYFNDFYGHQAGDECLKRVSRIISNVPRRPFDFCARLGGEEFAIVFYGTSIGEAPTQVAEDLREKIMAESIPHAHSEVARVVTVSIGSAVGAPLSGRSLERLVQAADEALYRAKHSGRNQVVHNDFESSCSDTGDFRARKFA